MTKKYICIRCPQGCEISTTVDGYGNITEITGNSCKLGIEHAKAESTDPRRTLTTTVQVTGGELSVCPVWTEKPIPKDMVLKAAEAIHNIILKAPVTKKQIIIEDVAGTGVNVIASRDIKAI